MFKSTLLPRLPNGSQDLFEVTIERHSEVTSFLHVGVLHSVDDVSNIHSNIIIIIINSFSFPLRRLPVSQGLSSKSSFSLSPFFPSPFLFPLSFHQETADVVFTCATGYSLGRPWVEQWRTPRDAMLIYRPMQLTIPKFRGSTRNPEAAPPHCICMDM